MVVFLVPLGRDHHELYCEVADPPPDSAAEQKGFLRSIKRTFREMLAAAEQERRARLAGHLTDEPSGWWGRMKGRTLRWAAETIAEQRLLWHLRGCLEARLDYPDDLSESGARDVLRAQLTSDYDKHRRWLVIDLLGFVASGVFMLVPGPNVLAYYFAFRLVGHFLSVRGAMQGLDRTMWQYCPRPELREVRDIVAADGLPDRRSRLREIETRLRLEHFAAFVERVVYSAR